MKPIRLTAAALALATVGIGGAKEAGASGFAIRENSAEALGTAFAGNASSATFLSTIFNNPAGMTHFTGDRAQLDASFIFPSSRFEGSSTQTITGVGTFPVTGSGSGNAGQAAFVPAGYYLHSFSPDLKFGLALTSPFGLETKYPTDWVGRYFGIKSSLETIDVNPNLAYRVNNWLSVGAGVSAQYLNADLTSAINQTAFSAGDGNLRLTGEDWGFGYNAGILVEPWDSTAFGLTYRSRVRHDVQGQADFTNISPGLAAAGGATVQTSNAEGTVVTPDSIDLSVTQKLTDKLRVAGDLQWTNWSVFQTLGFIRTSGGAAGTNIGNPTLEHFRDTWFVSLGTTYNIDDNWTVRSGIAYDQTPVTDFYRTVRLPDSDRYWLALGAGYKFSEGFSVDVGYSHIFMPNASMNGSVNGTTTIAGGTTSIAGSYKNQIDLISLQTRFRF
ncbi:MAG TPA: outer membrane protein transport protein [Stellaceae bacterium]|nr:outer membrane protein transport protein [Stellaceae bacterium]